MASTSFINTDDRLFQLLQKNMNTDDQKLFIKSFYLYLEYGNDNTQYVIDLDDIYEWIGFTRKGSCKTLLLKHFKEDKHYKILLQQLLKQNNKDEGSGGHNKETILLNINTFKKLCMKAATERADQICDYYLKMENIYMQYIKEKTSNLLKLEDTNELNMIKFRDEQILREYKNQLGVYIFMLDPSFDNDSIYFNFGSTSNITNRRGDHVCNFKGIKIYFHLFYKTPYYISMEKQIRNDHFINKNKIKYNNHNEMFTIKNTKESYDYTLSKVK